MNGEIELSIIEEVRSDFAETENDVVPDLSDDLLANAGNAFVPVTSEDTAKKKVGFAHIISRMICAFLAFVGIASYVWAGYKGFKYFADGNFEQIALAAVFGGRITMVEADPLTYETEYDDEEQPYTAEKYLKLSREDIGCSTPDIIHNETDYRIPDSIITSKVSGYRHGDTVLIIHTHGTEAFAPEGDIPEDEDFRTDDITQNIVAVGSAFAKILESKGVNVIHSTEMFDESSYVDAYKRSGAAVVDYMKKHPDISYVFDIHRDAVVRTDGTVVGSDGGSGAQLMLVMGTDEMGADFPDWRDNLLFGRQYQHRLYERDPKLIRHMNLRGASFNQQLCDKYILLEVGTSGNTLAEAVASAEVAADVFADMILGK